MIIIQVTPASVGAFILICGFFGTIVYMLLESKFGKIYVSKDEGSEIKNWLVRVEGKLDHLILNQVTN